MAELQSDSSMGEHCKGNRGYSQAGIDQKGKEWMERDMRTGSAREQWNATVPNRRSQIVPSLCVVKLRCQCAFKINLGAIVFCVEYKHQHK